MQQRISLVTLGVRDLARSRQFYEDGLGWQASEFSNDEVAFYQVGGLVFGLFGADALAEDSGVPAPPTADGEPPFRGTTLAHNVPNPQMVDALLIEAEQAGGRIVNPAADKFWGGYAGNFADPDGHIWEVAWNPHFELLSNGEVRLGR